MAYVTGLTAARMLEIADETVNAGYINELGNLMLVTHGGTEINAGHVYGATGTGVSTVTPFFLQQGKGANPPSAPMVKEPLSDSPWKLTEPAYVANTDLYMTTRVVYTDNTFQYTIPVKSSSYTGVGEAATAAAQASEAAAAADARSTNAYNDAVQAVADANAAKTQAQQAFDKANSVEIQLPDLEAALATAQADADQALIDAQHAQADANAASQNIVTLSGRTGRLIRQADQPTSSEDNNSNNLWLDTDTGQLYQYSGSQWVVITDSRLTAAANAADAASNLASSAQQNATAANNLASAAQTKANDAYTLAGSASSAASAASSSASSAQSKADTAAASAATAQTRADLAFNKALIAANNGANLILNGSFDIVDSNSAPLDWDLPNASNRFYPSGVARTGTYCLRVVTATASYGTYQSGRWFPADTNKSYYLEVWVKKEASAVVQNLGFIVQGRDASNAVVQTLYVIKASDQLTDPGWNRISGRIKFTTAGIVSARIGLYTAGGTGGQYLFDDVLAFDITEAAAAQATADAAVTYAATAKSAADAAAADALLAQQKADTANNTATTANGRITVAAANPVPADGAGKPVNALWEVRSGSTVLRRFLWNGTTWDQVKLGTDFIGDKAIGQAQIADAAVGTLQVGDGSITNAKIGSLSVGKLTATEGATFPTAVTDVLFADQAFVNQLLAERAIVTGQGNRIQNGSLDTGSVAPWSASIFTLDTVDKPVGTAASIKTAAGQGTAGSPTSGLMFGVVPGAKYRFEIWLKASLPNSLFYMELRDQSGAQAVTNAVFEPASGGIYTGGSVYLVNARYLNTVWTKYTMTFTMSPTATKVRIGSIYFNHVNGSERNAVISMAGISLKQIVSADLVVDGSVLIGNLSPEVMETVQQNITTQTGSLQESMSEQISTSISDAIVDIPDTYATKTELDELEVSGTAYSDSIRDDVSSTIASLGTVVETLQSDVDARNSLYDVYFYLSPTEGLVIGQANSPFKVRLTNNAMTFEESGVVVAYVSNKKLFITDGEFVNSMVLGKFNFVPRSNGNLSFKYKG